MTPEERLELAHGLEQRHQHGDALLAYARAIAEAQARGAWLDRNSTSSAIVDRVVHAIRYVKAGRRRAFELVLEPIFKRHGRNALKRFEDCLAYQAGERRLTTGDVRQQPSILYFPGLPATPYFDRSAFGWFADLERHTDSIREELLAVMPRTHLSESVFGTEAAEKLGLAGERGPPSWNGFYFWRHGERRVENLALCPRTSAVLESLPLARIREHAPEVMFSVLEPGSHILPHRGVTNTRAVCHLPLVVPEDCALVVAGEHHVWREGKAVAFDDTYEHEAWNRGSATRVVLIIDVWNPHLTFPEREAVAELVAAMGDFNKAAGI